MAVENTTVFLDFQAGYEGSIPFTRSKFFSCLGPAAKLILTNGQFAVACLAGFACSLMRSSCAFPGWPHRRAGSVPLPLAFLGVVIDACETFFG
jgi:hypothetical protein